MAMHTLPQDIMFNILSRLPVKNLCKFKCVAKQWCNMISDPCFIYWHRDRSKKYPQLLLVDHLDDNSNRNMGQQVICISSMDLEEEREQYKFTQAVDGNVDLLPSGHVLVCFVSYKYFYICNPITHEVLSLPEPSPSTFEEIDAGFGYLPTTNEYKLVHLFSRSSDAFMYDIGCEIFTLSDGGGVGSQSWRVLEESCPYPVCGCGVLANNAFYWIVWKDRLILSFNVEEENFGSFAPPPVPCELQDLVLVEMAGFLCLVDGLSFPSVMDIWMLKDHNNKAWVKEYSFNLIDLHGFDSELMEVTPLGYRNGEIIVDSEKKMLDYYNLENKSFRSGENLNLQDYTKLCLYTDSFFSLGSR